MDQTQVSKRVLLVVARRYNGHELWTALKLLQANKIDFEVVSTDYLVRDEITLQPNNIDRILTDLPENVVDDFDGFMIVSGNMDDTEAYWEHPIVQKLVKDFDAAGKAIAAICCSAPTIACVARDKRVSAYPLIRSRHHLARFGALLQNVSVSVDGNLVTAENQMVTHLWTNTFIRVLNGERDIDLGLIPDQFHRKLKERMPVPALDAAIAYVKRNQGQ